MEITIGEALDRILKRCGKQEAELYQQDGMSMSILIRWAADLQALAAHLNGDLDDILKESRAWKLSLSKGPGDTGIRTLGDDDISMIEEENRQMDQLLKPDARYC